MCVDPWDGALECDCNDPPPLPEPRRERELTLPQRATSNWRKRRWQMHQYDSYLVVSVSEAMTAVFLI